MTRMGVRIAALGVAIGLLAGSAWAQERGAQERGAQDLTLSGPEGQTATLTPADIAALPHVKLSVTIEGKTATYDGVPLTQLLARVGAPSGKALHGPALRDVVLVAGGDGYAAALALADTDPAMRKDQILLVDRADGQPLGPTAGPYRLVVEGDLRAARCVRMVTRIEVRTEH